MWGSGRRGGLAAFIIGITLALGASVPGRTADLVADPIGGMGHGELFDPSGRPINVTPSFIREAQEFYIRRLLAAANAKTRSDFEKVRPLASVGLSEQAKLIGNAELIEWLIDRVRPADSGALRAKNNFLRMLLRWRISPVNQPVSRDQPLFVLPNDVAARFVGISSGLEGVAEPAGPSYAQECDRAGVPVPPDWGGPGWESKGILKDEFISAGLEAEVFVFDSASPQGLCIALPRSNGKAIELLGIICSGKATGKACFWDNQVDKKSVDVPLGARKPLLSFAAGPELEGGSGGVCTSCHRGENPFIIHPRTALGLPNLAGLKLKTDRWYSPIVAASWPQNPGPGNYPADAGSEGDCQECHVQGGKGGRFPRLETPSLYCGILASAIARTMPLDRAAVEDYKAHAEALTKRCVTG